MTCRRSTRADLPRLRRRSSAAGARRKSAGAASPCTDARHAQQTRRRRLFVAARCVDIIASTRRYPTSRRVLAPSFERARLRRHPSARIGPRAFPAPESADENAGARRSRRGGRDSRPSIAGASPRRTRDARAVSASIRRRLERLTSLFPAARPRRSIPSVDPFLFSFSRLPPSQTLSTQPGTFFSFQIFFF